MLSTWCVLISPGIGAVMAGLLLWGVGELNLWFEWGVWERVSRLAAMIGAGGAVYYVVLFLLGIRVRHFRST